MSDGNINCWFDKRSFAKINRLSLQTVMFILCYITNDEPQLQVLVAFGFST